jgi:glutathione S-transferase
MLRLYIANKNYSSWSLRPWILMKELGIPFEETLVPFGNVPGSVPYTTFSPTGRVPCMLDGDLTVWDSLAITEYLAESHSGIWPADKATRAWARSACAEMHSGFQQIRNICTMNCGIRVQLHEESPALRADWKRVGELWGEGLQRFGGPYLAGPRFTAVDAFFAPFAFRIQTYSPTVSEAARAYAQRLRKLPHMQAWYEAALKESWRDEGHEVEAREVGTWVQDLRTQ